MKKLMMLWFAAIALILSAATNTAVARNDAAHSNGEGFHGNAAGMHHDGGRHIEARHGFHRFHDFNGRSRVIVGGPFFWSPLYVDPAFYPGTTSLIYVAPATGYSYYCSNPVGYYPDVPNCPGGWLQVVPE